MAMRRKRIGIFTEKINVAVTERLKLELKAEARGQAKSVSELVRDCLLNRKSAQIWKSKAKKLELKVQRLAQRNSEHRALLHGKRTALVEKLVEVESDLEQVRKALLSGDGA